MGTYLSKLKESSGYNIPNNITEEIAEQLYSRGLIHYDSNAGIFRQAVSKGQGSPSDFEGQLSDIAKAIDYILDPQYSSFTSKILIMGDYDNDGITSEAILDYSMKKLSKERGKKAEIEIYHPRREQGFGALGDIEQMFKEKKITTNDILLITDTGSNKIEELNDLMNRYKEHPAIYIMDHHPFSMNRSFYYNSDSDLYSKKMRVANPAEHSMFSMLANSSAMFNKETITPYHTPYSAGGIAKKFADALGVTDNNIKVLATLSTLGDQVPLVGENVDIVMEGLSVIRDQKLHGDLLPGLQALIKEAIPYDYANNTELTAANITIDDILFKLVPMSNAMNRMEYDEEFQGVFGGGKPVSGASLMSEFIKTGKIGNLDTKESLKKIKHFNEKRKDITNDILKHVYRNLAVRRQGMGEEAWSKLTGLVISEINNEQNKEVYIPDSIAGLISSDVVNRLGLPTITLSRQKDGSWKGSGRAPEGLSVSEQFSAAKGQMKIEGGGHPGAIGISKLAAEDLQTFQESFEGASQVKYDMKNIAPIMMEPQKITKEFVTDLQALMGPTGSGNPPLTFRGTFKLSDITTDKKKGVHLFAKTPGQKNDIKVNFFGGGLYMNNLQANQEITADYGVRVYENHLEINLKNVDNLKGIMPGETVVGEQEKPPEDSSTEVLGENSEDISVEKEALEEITQEESRLNRRIGNSFELTKKENAADIQAIHDKFRSSVEYRTININGRSLSPDSAISQTLNALYQLEHGGPDGSGVPGYQKGTYADALSIAKRLPEQMLNMSFADIRNTNTELTQKRNGGKDISSLKWYDQSYEKYLELRGKHSQAFKDVLSALNSELEKNKSLGFEFDNAISFDRVQMANVSTKAKSYSSISHTYKPEDVLRSGNTPQWRFYETLRQLQDSQYEENEWLGDMVDSIRRRINNTTGMGRSFSSQYYYLIGEGVKDYVSRNFNDIYNKINDIDKNFSYRNILSTHDPREYKEWLQDQLEILRRDKNTLELYISGQISFTPEEKKNIIENKNLSIKQKLRGVREIVSGESFVTAYNQLFSYKDNGALIPAFEDAFLYKISPELQNQYSGEHDKAQKVAQLYLKQTPEYQTYKDTFGKEYNPGKSSIWYWRQNMKEELDSSLEKIDKSYKGRTEESILEELTNFVTGKGRSIEGLDSKQNTLAKIRYLRMLNADFDDFQNMISLTEEEKEKTTEEEWSDDLKARTREIRRNKEAWGLTPLTDEEKERLKKQGSIAPSGFLSDVTFYDGKYYRTGIDDDNLPTDIHFKNLMENNPEEFKRLYEESGGSTRRYIVSQLDPDSTSGYLENYDKYGGRYYSTDELRQKVQAELFALDRDKIPDFLEEKENIDISGEEFEALSDSEKEKRKQEHARIALHNKEVRTRKRYLERSYVDEKENEYADLSTVEEAKKENPALKVFSRYADFSRLGNQKEGYHYYRVSDLIPGETGDIRNFKDIVDEHFSTGNDVINRAIAFTEYMNEENIGQARRTIYGWEKYKYSEGNPKATAEAWRLKGTRKIGNISFTEKMIEEFLGRKASNNLDEDITTVSQKIAMSLSREDFTKYREMSKEVAQKVDIDTMYRRAVWSLDWEKDGNRMIAPGVRPLYLTDDKQWFRKQDNLEDFLKKKFGNNIDLSSVSSAGTFEDKISAAQALIDSQRSLKNRERLSKLSHDEWLNAITYKYNKGESTEEYKTRAPEEYEKINRNRRDWGGKWIEEEGKTSYWEFSDAEKFDGEWYRTNEDAKELVAAKTAATKYIQGVLENPPAGFSVEYLKNIKDLDSQYRAAKRFTEEYTPLFNEAVQNYGTISLETLNTNLQDQKHGWIYHQAYKQAAKNTGDEWDLFQIQGTYYRKSQDSDRVTKFNGQYFREGVDDAELGAAKAALERENEELTTELKSKKIYTGEADKETDPVKRNKALKKIVDNPKYSDEEVFAEVENAAKNLSEQLGVAIEDHILVPAAKTISNKKDFILDGIYGEESRNEPPRPDPYASPRAARRSPSKWGPRMAQHMPPLLGFIGTAGAVTLFDAAFSKPKDDWEYYKQQRQQRGGTPLGYLW